MQFSVGQDAYTDSPSGDFRFASAVTEFGLILIDSQYQGQASLANIRELAGSSIGNDTYGLRAEFVELLDACSRID